MTFGQNPLDDWTGEYEGDMILGFANKPNDTIPVTFSMKNTIVDSVWTYTMNYKSEKYGDITKDYVIRSKTKGDKSNFVLDELNGILMDETYMNGTLYGMYEVMEQFYISTIRKTEYGLYFELISSSVSSPLISKTNEKVGEDFIDASSYKPILHQTVKLVKQ